jgi:hypothetical protein
MAASDLPLAESDLPLAESALNKRNGARRVAQARLGPAVRSVFMRQL